MIDCAFPFLLRQGVLRLWEMAKTMSDIIRIMSDIVFAISHVVFYGWLDKSAKRHLSGNYKVYW